MPPTCPYCNAVSVLASSAEVYGGRDFGMIYLCANYPQCDAYVGVHRHTDTPKGTLANTELRAARKRAHAAFDPLWQWAETPRERRKLRAKWYRWMMEMMDLTYDEAGHVEHQSVEAAAKAWNARPAEDALRSRMAEARAMLNEHPLDINVGKLRALLTEE